MRADPSKYIPTSVDTAEQWIEWHKTLNKWFSLNETNAQWLRFWNQRAGAGSEADTHELRSYMSDQGVNITTDMSGAVTDSVMDVVDWFGDTFNWLRGIVIGAVILAIALVAFYIIMGSIHRKSAQQMALDAPIPIPVRGNNMTRLLT